MTLQSEEFSQYFMHQEMLAKKHPKDRAISKLTSPVQLFIMQLVMLNPGIYLHEIKSQLQDTLLVDVNISTICRFLHDAGFSRQRLQLCAMQRNEVSREQFIIDVSVYNAEMLIFIDETGSDRRDTNRKYGYSLRGKPLKRFVPLIRGERVSAIAGISMAGLLDVQVSVGATDGDAFYNYIQKYLLPHLMPFNGLNPHSVIIMDNCSIHHIPEVARSILDVGALVHYLPPYLPDFAPIENAFSKVKQLLLSADNSEDMHDDLETLVLAAFTQITPSDCQHWIFDTGIYITEN